MNFEYGYSGLAGGGGSGEHVTVGSSSPAERVIDPQGEVNDIVDSARDLKRVIDRQEQEIKVFRDAALSSKFMMGVMQRDLDSLHGQSKEQLERLAERLVKIDALASENCKLHAQLKDAADENAKLRSAMPYGATESQAAAWCAVWEQISFPHTPSTSGSGIAKALHRIRRWQEMERKLKGIING